MNYKFIAFHNNKSLNRINEIKDLFLKYSDSIDINFYAEYNHLKLTEPIKLTNDNISIIKVRDIQHLDYYLLRIDLPFERISYTQFDVNETLEMLYNGELKLPMMDIKLNYKMFDKIELKGNVKKVSEVLLNIVGCSQLGMDINSEKIKYFGFGLLNDIPIMLENNDTKYAYWAGVSGCNYNMIDSTGGNHDLHFYNDYKCTVNVPEKWFKNTKGDIIMDKILQIKIMNNL